jgi:biopolymer transport protein ExbB
MSVFDFSLFAKGGPMMWVLLGLGLFALMLFVERTLYLHRGQIRSTAFLGGIKNILAKRRIVEALTVCEETPGPVAAVVKAALMHADDDPDTMRFHVQEAAVVELPALERRLGSLAAIAQVAPLVGLLGTVLGMVTTFLAFEKDYMSATALAHGMWQALLATAGSLMLAIPAHLAHHFLSGRVRAIVRDVEWAGNEIMKYLLTEYRGAGPANGGQAEERSASGVEKT